MGTASVSDEEVVACDQIGQEFPSSIIRSRTQDTALRIEVSDEDNALSGIKTEGTIKVIEEFSELPDLVVWGIVATIYGNTAEITAYKTI